MWLRRFFFWLLFGNDELRLPKSWLANHARLAEYDDWTQLQRESYVTKDTAHFQRVAFWKAIESKPVKTSAKILRARF